ncbi:MAG TPA: hypothetical protein VGQ87_01375 [Patescibacteria group bacterium]|jgi:hypothetical protein|nr:hypothetical protein [Patescibacteria group bacterium]
METVFLNFIEGPFLNWLPRIFFGFVFILAAILYYRQKKQIPGSFLHLTYKKLIVTASAFYILFAASLTWAQYYIWSQNKFTKLLLTTPLDQKSLGEVFKHFPWLFKFKLGYFIIYVAERFWLEVLLAFVITALFYFFLKSLSKYREEFFEPEELQLALLLGLIMGWPNFVVFLILSFVMVVLISIFNRFYLKEEYTTLSLAFLIAAGSTLLFGTKLLVMLNFTTLKV